MHNKVYFSESKPGGYTKQTLGLRLKPIFQAKIQHREIDLFGENL